MSQRDIPSQYERPALSQSELSARIKAMEVGDEVVFGDRKNPLEVVEHNAEGNNIVGVRIKSSFDGKDPRGVYHILSYDGDYYQSSSNIARRSLEWVMNVTAERH
ncbi:hypothetical protein [Natronosalvus vescus]|uniref:hypothetical protein n=1 Tax=Natronosalvus vescus TaxID=2953881 RepID=UPI002090D200|nr:hypothetical protein [Natronosalvus vescus]